MITRERGELWRAVDDAGDVLGILVQRRRTALAAKLFFRTLLKGLWMVPRAIVTDRLAGYAAAKAVVVSEGCICNQVRPGRHALSAPSHRTVTRGRCRKWDTVSETTAFAVAA